MEPPRGNAHMQLLLDVMRSGKSNLVARVLHDGVDIHATGPNGETPLHLAAQYGNAGIASFLVGRGARIHARNKNGDTPLHLAALYSNTDVITCLLERGANIHARNNNGEMPLFYSVNGLLSIDKCIESAKLLCRRRARWDDAWTANVKDAERRGLVLSVKFWQEEAELAVIQLTEIPVDEIKLGETSIEAFLVEQRKLRRKRILDAMRRGDHAELTRLKKRGPSHGPGGMYATTLLHEAARRCDDTEELRRGTEYMLRQGFDVGPRDMRNDGPERVMFLLEQGADVGARDAVGRTPLHYAGSAASARILLERDADVNARCRKEETPLHAAATRSDTGIITCLLEYGAEINARDQNGQAPLHFAARYGKKDAVACLVGEGADIDPQDKEERTPLHLAMYHHRNESVMYLSESGADVDARDKDGYSPLVSAVHRVEAAYADTCVKGVENIRVLCRAGARWEEAWNAIINKTEQQGCVACIRHWQEEAERGIELTDVPLAIIKFGTAAVEKYLRSLEQTPP